MKQFLAWLSHLTRYTLRKKLFWFLPLTLLLISIASAIAAGRHQLIRIPLYCSSPDSLTRTAMDELIASDDGLYRFYEAPSLEYLQEDVASRKAECGYLFPDRLEERLQLGEEQLITAYTSSATVLTSIVNETVYNAIFHGYAKTMLTGYILSGDVISMDTEALRRMVDAQFAYEEETVPVFHVVYEDVSEAFYDNQSAFRIPLRGFLALLIFLSALAGVSQFRHDRQNGYFLLRHPLERKYVSAIYALLPALLLAVSGFFCLILAGSSLTGLGLLAELLILPVFAAVCAILALALSVLVKSSIAYDALIPILMIFCLLYAPVFMDLTPYLPGGELLQWATPVSWYLELIALLR